MPFKKAERKQLKLRMAIDGPSGSGKSYTALRFAFALGKRIAVIDSEHESASKYVGEAPDGIVWRFDVNELSRFSPADYTNAIEEAERLGCDVLVIDSLSHAWNGEGGALEMADRAGGKFQAWRTVTPIHNKMMETILRFPAHVIVTMRSKMDYVLEEDVDDRGKKKLTPRKVGLAPIQRNGAEYEYDIYCSLDLNHILTVTKSRCSRVDSAIAALPTASFMRPVIEWLQGGSSALEQTADGADSESDAALPKAAGASTVEDEALEKLRAGISRLRRKNEWMLGQQAGDDSDLNDKNEVRLQAIGGELESAYAETLRSKISSVCKATQKLDPKAKTPALQSLSIPLLEALYKSSVEKLKERRNGAVGSEGAKTSAEERAGLNG